ncbi:putative UDP-N-acetylglucosamine--peptide N-acetylglucosaminyltransferase SPINDLY-like isoform X2 [Capsicum annuum]|uniref:probable UDP-N-acetylglucosamine--peptide N-acetylglucosaminyltransferase SPINDLY isoform X2 n=1 Tax=Capsicum annuum TaxID=4072 RepID=UPI0007BEB6EE|nr:probable UDP-N-acetylglucosamine--peptide N-acetylglucosaminyltransferase SPINDLY isoform X2 [Capsicum annuum]KAF3647479.1 putative UDP-N-acetylglucosamine--peptide N-acetylglucosaminyltransferase SPINDLY-like isoform X2 [Capsicum annuum]
MTEIPASNSVEIPSMKSESAAGDRNSGGFRIQPPLQYHPPSKIVLADLNVDPPDSDGNDSVPIAAVSPACLSRVIADEICQDKLKKEVEITDTEGKQLKKLGKCRSRMGKLDCPPDCNGADAEADHNVQGVPSSREEKVSSLKTGLIHVARKMPKNAHAHFVLGLMYQRMGQPQKAILAYEKAEEILVLSEEAIDRPELLSLVQVHHAQCILLGTLEDCSSDKELDPEELENILAKLKEAVKSDVRQVSIWNALGIILLRTGRLQSAISVFSTLLDISPDDLDCLGNLGIACLQSGNLELSEKCFQDLLLKDQNHPTALINYAALILYKYGSEVAGAGANSLYGTSADQITAANVAKECLLAALKADSKAAHIWTNLANAYYLMSDHRSSAKCLEKAGKIEPNCLATRYAVGVHRIRDAERSQNPNEQLTWAGSEMASILREGDSTSIEPPVAWTGLAMVHRAQHEIVAGFEIEQNELVEVKEHAIYSLKQAIAEDPADPVQWHQLGLHNLCTQQFKTSQMYLKAAVARCKDCTYAWSNLGISLQLSEDSSQAEEVYKQALSLATSKQAHTIFSNLGNLYRQLKQYECAKAMYNKSLELQPGYAPALNNLGLVFVAQGKWEEAKDYFNKAIQVDPLLDAAKSNMIKASHMFNITSMS